MLVDDEICIKLCSKVTILLLVLFVVVVDTVIVMSLKYRSGGWVKWLVYLFIGGSAVAEVGTRPLMYILSSLACMIYEKLHVNSAHVYILVTSSYI